MQLFCPSCQRQLRVPENAAGKQVQCPACQKIFTAGDETTQQQIQAPRLPRQMPVAPPPDDSFEDLPRPRRVRHEDDADFIERRDDYEARQRVQGAAVWFYVAAGVTMLVAVINMTMAVSQAAITAWPHNTPPAWTSGGATGISSVASPGRASISTRPRLRTHGASTPSKALRRASRSRVDVGAAIA